MTENRSTMFGGPQQPAFLNSVVGLTGITHAADLNGGNANSVAFTPNVCFPPSCHLHFILYHIQSLDVNNGDIRSSAATAYLTPVENRRKSWLTLVGHQVGYITTILFPVTHKLTYRLQKSISPEPAQQV
jgi:hypothetical protein